MGQQTLTARGYFITVEGGEGAGKSTQVKRLAAALGAAGLPVIRTREPGGSDGAEAIRQLLIEGDTERWDATGEALLLYAARREHVTRLIQPALAAGSWVICDRFNDSTVAYQGYGRGLPLDELRALQHFAIGNFQPDLTLMLDLPVAAGFARAALRPRRADRFERLDHGFHERLRQGFLAIAAAAPARCVVLDASGDADAVYRAIAAVIADRFGVRFGVGLG